jgi:hypothetical protein
LPVANQLAVSKVAGNFQRIPLAAFLGSIGKTQFQLSIAEGAAYVGGSPLARHFFTVQLNYRIHFPVPTGRIQHKVPFA